MKILEKYLKIFVFFWRGGAALLLPRKTDDEMSQCKVPTLYCTGMVPNVFSTSRDARYYFLNIFQEGRKSSIEYTNLVKLTDIILKFRLSRTLNFLRSH